MAFSGAVTAGGTAFDLTPGANLATVTVTAENGDTRDYTITINREQDTEVPTVAISGPSTTQKEAFTVTFTWSETVIGVSLLTDVTLSSGSLGGFAQDTTDQLVWTATVTPATGQQGNLTVTVAAAAVTDGINNNAVALKNFAVDTKKPTATLTVQGRSLYAPGIHQRRGHRVSYSTASFDEDVKPFDSNSVTVTNGSVQYDGRMPPGAVSWSDPATLCCCPFCRRHGHGYSEYRFGGGRGGQYHRSHNCGECAQSTTDQPQRLKCHRPARLWCPPRSTSVSCSGRSVTGFEADRHRRRQRDGCRTSPAAAIPTAPTSLPPRMAP